MTKTLEETNWEVLGTKTDTFYNGAKWQQERSYSEEDMTKTFHYGHQVGMNSILAIQSKHSPQPIAKPDVDKLKKRMV